MNQIAQYSSSEDEEETGPPIPDEFQQKVPPNRSAKNEIDEENEELIGPPVPKQLVRKVEGVQGGEYTNNLKNMYIRDYGGDSDKSGSDDELVGPPVPSSLLTAAGDTTESSADEGTDEETVGQPFSRGSSDKKSRSSHKEESDGQSEDSDEGDDLNLSGQLPLSRNISIVHGSKPVVALAIDPSGTRLASGSVDYEVKFWDFAGMDTTLQSFRKMNPCGNNPIKLLEYSATGDNVLVISGMSQAKVLDRDGYEVMECVKGDQYVSDMARTKGHIAPLNYGSWHPRTREEFLTAAGDGTCRIWNVSDPLNHKSVIKCRAANGLKTNPTACCYSRDGNLVACACQDGSLQLWDHRKAFVNPCKTIRAAHQNGSDTSCVTFNYASNMIATRGGDDTLKLWDLKNFKNPLHEFSGIYSRYSTTNCMFSPNDSMIVTGVSLEKGEKEGKLIIFDAKSYGKVKEVVVCESHVVQTLWHPRLHQIFIGCGDGNVIAYFNDSKLARGAQLCASKTRKKTKHVEVVAAQQIITPHSLPAFRQERPKLLRKKLEKERQDPVKSKRPDLPINSGQGGRVAASGSTLSSYVIRNLGLSKRVDDEQDPREAILRFAKDAEENPYWITPAYKRTQPNTIFQNEPEDPDQPKTKKTKI